MKKLNVILDETTIINFSFFKKLLIRYKLLSTIIVLISVTSFTYYYQKQYDIYRISKTFKNVSNDSDSPLTTISNIVGESKKGISEEEVVSSLNSIDFVRNLAETIYEGQDFLEINFSDLLVKDSRTTAEVYAGCERERECIINYLMERLPELYDVNINGMVQNNFTLTVKTLDQKSSRFILRSLEDAIQSSRVSTIRRVHSQQKDITQKLLETKISELDNADPNKLQQQEESLGESVKQYNERISIVSRDYHSLKIQMDLLDSQLEQTNKALNSQTKKDYNYKLAKKAKVISSKIEKYRQDISAIEVAQSDFQEDSSILDQLRAELTKAEGELKAIPNYKLYVGGTEAFLKKKDKSSVNVRFDSKVKKRQFERVRNELQSLQAKRNETVQKKKEVSSKLKMIKPTMDYIKLLKEKLLQLQIIESTIVSDYVFSDNVSGISVFKRTSLAKVVLFCGFSTLFCLFTFVLVRYLLDTKIYDEYELNKNYENIDVIGKTPDFNS